MSTHPNDRRKELTRRLDEIDVQTATLAVEEKRIEAEIADIGQRLRPQRRLPLAKTMIASPCDVPWAEMKGDDRSRFCQSCEKHVHNLSAMTTAEIETFLETAPKVGTCVRLFERTDGTILTADCPVGVKRRRMRSLVLASLGAGACALFGFTSIALALTLTHVATSKANEKPVLLPPATVPTHVTTATHVATATERAPSLPRSPEGTGWLLIDGPSDIRVSEGPRVLGTLPVVVTLPAGAHALRFEKTGARPWTLPASVTAGKSAEMHVNAPETYVEMAGRRRAKDDPFDPKF